MHQMKSSLVPMTEFILFMQLHRYMVNTKAGFKFMSMDLKRLIIFFGIMVLEVPNINTSAQMLYSN